MCASSCMLIPPTTYNLINVVWLIVNVEIIYLHNEVSGDQFYGQTVTGINPVTSEFSISCCYF